MQSHRNEVVALVRLLAYLLKKTDPDGIDIYFTMTNHHHRSKSSSQIVKALKNHDPPADRCNIRTRLLKIVGDYQTKLDKQKQVGTYRRLSITRTPAQVRPLSLYVLTDGVWQPGNDITDIVDNLVTCLKEHKLPREQFGIQFIRFGNDSEGVERLARLDSKLGLEM